MYTMMSEQAGTRDFYIPNNHSKVLRYSAERSEKTNAIFVLSPV